MTRFAAEFPEPFQLYPIKPNPSAAENESFIKGVWFKKLELVDEPPTPPKTDRQCKVSIDGSIEFGKPPNVSLDILSKIDGRLISFRDLGIRLLGLPSLSARLLEITYPSLSFDLDFPHVSLLGDALRLKLNQLALNWGTSPFQFPGFLDLGLDNPKWSVSLPHIFFLGKVDFGGLPSLFARTLSGFSLELGFGLNFDKANSILTGGRSIRVRGFGFDGLNLDLTGFLKISIKKVTLGALPPSPADPTRAGSQIGFTDVSVEILKHKIFEGANGGFFSLSQGRGNGFWAYFPATGDTPFLGYFNWGFAAQNVDFDPSVAKALLVPPDVNEADSDADAAAQLGNQLSTYWQQGKIRPASGADPHGWTFAAQISVFDGLLKGRALIQDAGYAGLALWGEELKRWFGYNFSFCGIYRKNITPGQDYFYISVTLPAVTLSGVQFTGGVIAAEIYTSGSFLLDFGFPWPSPSGGRLWDRTIGAIVTPGQASGGFYLRKMESDVAGVHELAIGGGLAIQWGLGAAFGGGIFTAWVRIGLYAALEGQALLVSDIAKGNLNLQSLTVAGAGGILVEGQGAIDWWVISVTVHVCASAEVRMLLQWSKGQNTTIQLAAELYVSASAQACVGGGCFRICKSISVGLTIPANYTLSF